MGKLQDKVAVISGGSSGLVWPRQSCSNSTALREGQINRLPTTQGERA